MLAQRRGAGAGEGWRRRTLLLCTWLALLVQLIVPAVCAAAPAHEAATMAICTADGTRFIPVPDDAPAAPAHDPHDLCGLCCVSCARHGLGLRIATLVPPPAIVSDQAWALPEHALAAAAVPEHRRPPGRAPPPILV